MRQRERSWFKLPSPLLGEGTGVRALMRQRHDNLTEDQSILCVSVFSSPLVSAPPLHQPVEGTAVAGVGPRFPGFDAEA